MKVKALLLICLVVLSASAVVTCFAFSFSSYTVQGNLANACGTLLIDDEIVEPDGEEIDTPVMPT